MNSLYRPTRIMSLPATAAVAALLAGCAATPVEQPKPPAPVVERPAPAAAPAPAPAPAPVARVDVAPKPIDPLTDPKSLLVQRSVFFDFDKYVIKPEFVPMVEAHGTFLVANRGRSIVIEGHADERGSREYNLALGQRRADAVKSRLGLLGVPAARVETVSFGEERPRATGQTEEAWAQNRRADIVYR